MIRAVLVQFALLVTCICAAGQASNDAKQPARFEVVSIRPASPDSIGGFSEPAGTEFRVKAIELSVLVQMAFGLNANQVVTPEWTQGKKFDIAAKTGSSVPLTYKQMRPLLQTMLAERFAMTYHRETRDLQGYDMVVARRGLKLAPANTISPRGGGGRPGAIDMPNTNVRDFAAMLTVMLKRPVAVRDG